DGVVAGRRGGPGAGELHPRIPDQARRPRVRRVFVHDVPHGIAAGRRVHRQLARGQRGPAVPLHDRGPDSPRVPADGRMSESHEGIDGAERIRVLLTWLVVAIPALWGVAQVV